MNNDQQEQKKLLEGQLQWSKEQACILDEINVILHEMKEIAEYTLTHELPPDEIEKLNSQLHDLKYVVHSLEKQLQQSVTQIW